MSQDEHDQARDDATDAHVGQAGPPAKSSDAPQGATEDGDEPTPEELDAREERFNAPRKAMGPGVEGADVPETVPEEG